VTDVAWFTLAQPTAGAAGDAAADDVPEADEAAGAPVGFEAVADAQPAIAKHSKAASTVARTWRGDLMLL
jgi:hypothetical protein